MLGIVTEVEALKKAEAEEKAATEQALREAELFFDLLQAPLESGDLRSMGRSG